MNENNCPECGEKSVIHCKCPCFQSECKNGHVWHKCTAHNEPIVVTGERDHGLSLSECSCPKESFDGFGWLQ